MQADKIEGKVISGLRITVFALVAGSLMLAAIVIALRYQMGPLAPQLTIIGNIALVVLIVAATSQFALLPTLDASKRRLIPNDQIELEKPFFKMWASRTIVGCALLEGATHLSFISAMLDGQLVGLISGLVAVVFMILLHWPTQERWQNYIERQRQMARNERGV